MTLPVAMEQDLRANLERLGVEPAAFPHNVLELLYWFMPQKYIPEDVVEGYHAYLALALKIASVTNPSAEQTTALRNLLTSKDAFVRAKILTPKKKEKLT